MVKKEMSLIDFGRLFQKDGPATEKDVTSIVFACKAHEMACGHELILLDNEYPRVKSYIASSQDIITSAVSLGSLTESWAILQ